MQSTLHEHWEMLSMILGMVYSYALKQEVATPIFYYHRRRQKKLCPSTFISTISEIISSSIIHSLILCFDNSIQFDAFYFCSTNYIKFIIDENMKKKSSPQQLPINPYFASFSLVRQRDIQFHGKKWLNLWC